MTYQIRRTHNRPSLTGDWDGPVWSKAETGHIQLSLPGRSFDHHPGVQFRLLYDTANLYLIFRVEDHYVRSVITEHNGNVCFDSCTEFFVKPKEDAGYINFEMNCGGAMLAYYIEDATIVSGKFANYVPLTLDDAALVLRYHSMPAVVDPEFQEPVTWYNELHIPFQLFEKYMGTIGNPCGQTWRANFYKCGDRTSHPHWLTWAPVVSGPNFHQPADFAPLVFSGT